MLGAQRAMRHDGPVERFDLLYDDHRRDVRTAEQMALQAIEPEIDELAAFALGFDAFGNDAATDCPPHVENRAHEFQFRFVGVDAAHEVAIDLHEIRLELRPGAQTR